MQESLLVVLVKHFSGRESFGNIFNTDGGIQYDDIKET